MAYDMQAHGEQIRHAQIKRDEALERAFDEASESAHIELAEMDGDTVAWIVWRNERLSEKLSHLLEAVAKLGLSTPHQTGDVQYAAANLFGALLDHISETNATLARSAK